MDCQKINENHHYKVALIGFGYWGKNLAKAISSTNNCSLKAIIDISADMLVSANKIYPAIKTSNNVDSIFEDDSYIDIVVIATPVSSHITLIKKSLKHGKHVLCEKIISKNEYELIEVYKTAKSKKLILKEGYTFLYNNAVKYIKENIEMKVFGKIYYCTFKRAGLGPFRKDVDVLYDLAPHDLSMLIYWFGPPKWVSGTSCCIFNNNVADVVFFQLGYSENMIVNVQVSWINPMKQRLVEIVGEKQMLIFDDVSVAEKIKIIKTGKDYNKYVSDFGSFQLSLKDGDIVIPNIHFFEPLKVEIEEFLKQIIYFDFDDKKLQLSLYIVQTLAAITHSINNEGKKVAL